MTVSYISVEQVTQNLQSLYNASDVIAVIPTLIQNCSAFLDTYCNRANGGFSIQSYDEIYNGTGEKLLFLNNTPIQSIQRISCTQLPTISIINQDSDVSARALVQINNAPSNPYNLASQNVSTGITLTYIKNGVTTTNTLNWTSYQTCTLLVAAINALGNHWSATVQGGFGGWSTTDLRATQGSFGARITTAYLWIHWFDVPSYRVNELTGEINCPFGFARGWGNWRIGYTAGYATVNEDGSVTNFPQDLGQALCEIVVNAYIARSQNSNMQSASLGGESYSQLATKSFEGCSIVTRNTINRYKIYKTGHFSLW